jgi:PPOX class probable F420-dependent enzyme
VDAKPKSTLELQRVRNVAARPAASLVVDHYDDDWTELWWIRVDGAARVIESGAERDAALDALAAKYPQYVESPPPGAVVAIDVETWRAWP